MFNFRLLTRRHISANNPKPINPHMVAAIIDSHPVFLNGLTQFLYQSMKNINVVRSVDLRQFDIARGDLRPDFIILGVNGTLGNREYKTFQAMRRALPNSKTIVFYDEIEMAIPFLKGGVNGFLAKKSNPQELTDCLDVVMKGKRYLNNEVFEMIIRGRV